VTLPQPPLVALVGRPNVGKSTLFNRFVGWRMALVDDQPGVTRDRIFGQGTHSQRVLRFVDTGGFDSDPNDPLLSRMREQTQIAIDEADLVLLILDGAEGLLPADREVAGILRRSGKPVIAVVNKTDTPEHEERRHEFHALGIDPVVTVSAEHGRGFGDVVDVLIERLDPPDAEAFEKQSGPIPVSEENEASPEPSHIEWPGGTIHVAIVGRPNVGKSSLVNRLLGEERMLATDIPGTTRDAVDSEIEVDGQKFVLIDTAGIRKKAAIADRVEKFAVMAARRSLERADVAMVVLDGTARPSEQDAKIIAMADKLGKGVILVANKWDLPENPEWKKKFPDAVRFDFPFVDYAPLLALSAKTGRGVERLLPLVLEVQRERHRRITTGELNRFFREVIEHHAPPQTKGKRAALYFVSQPLVRPPTFIITTGRTELVPESYTRFLVNQLRERYGFTGTPLWVKYRARGKAKAKEE
jgi:GTPase